MHLHENNSVLSKDKGELYQSNITGQVLAAEEDKSYEKLRDIILEAARDSGMLKRYMVGKPMGKIWYDSDCKKLREEIRVISKSIGKEGWTEALTKAYHDTRKLYRAIRRDKKEQYEASLRDNLQSCKNPSDFWAAVKSFRAAPTPPNSVDSAAWVEFYKEILPPRQIQITFANENYVPSLECNISEAEMVIALHKLKSKKSPGPDHISNEFLSNLPQEARSYLLDVLNSILYKEETPEAWSESTTVMIYKKGDPNEAINYRPIALLNTCLKLFTQILNTRITKWAEENNKLPMAQGGFRAGRGCDDLIFCLNSAIQLQLRKKKGKLFACYFDFSRAFPSCIHNKLWAKLDSIGMSSKIIRILQNLYGKAATVIRTEHGCSPSIELTEGLLQGEVLSPILYSLFISEIEEVLTKSGLLGIKVAVNKNCKFCCLPMIQW